MRNEILLTSGIFEGVKGIFLAYPVIYLVTGRSSRLPSLILLHRIPQITQKYIKI